LFLSNYHLFLALKQNFYNHRFRDYRKEETAAAQSDNTGHKMLSTGNIEAHCRITQMHHLLQQLCGKAVGQ
jgi:hypothetical protein